MLLGNKEPISIYSLLTIFSLMLSGTPIDISDEMLSIGIDVIHIENSQKLTIYQGELVLQKTQNKVKIDNIDQWTSAFIVFISILCKVYVSRFQEHCT
jgi:hypothetical protein